MTSKNSLQKLVAEPNQRKRILMVIVGLQLLVVAGLFFLFKSQPGEGDQSSGGSSSYYIPIWTALLVTFIATRSKNQKLQKSKYYWLLLIGLGLFVLLGLSAFLYWELAS